MLTKLDAAGHLVWAKAYGGRGTDGNRFNGEPVDLIVTPDGFAFTVATDSFGTDDALTTSRDFWVVKTDLDGNIPVMTGVMRDITAEVSVTPLANPSTVQHKSLAALNLTQYLPRDRTQAEIDAGIYPPVIHQELFGYGGAINDLTSTAVGVVPRVQSTPTYNSGAMQFAQANYQTDESDSSFVDVVVTRADTTHGAYGKASVNYTITPNGSTSATEFLAAPAELFQFAIPGFNSFHVDFEDGELTKAIRIRVIKDDNYEPNESITITLSDVDPLNDIALGTRTSTVVSFGDTTPFPGRAQFSASTYTVNEYKKTATITVNRVDGNGFVQVNYATVSGGTATAGSANVAGSDYESVSGTLTFDPFVTSQTFTISLFDDAATEGDETIKLQLSNVVNGELGSPILATVTIHDVELPAAQTIPTKYNGKIAFSRDVDSGILDLIVMNADGTGVTNITNTSAASESDVAWSPDGSKLAFTVFDFTDASANSGIFVSNADGTGRTRLTFSINDRLPTWSPDGSRIAYVSQGSLVLMNADGSNADSILTGSVFKPKWSPDGTHLVYQSSVGLSEIGVDGFGEREVLSAFAHVFDYSYSPNGTQLIVNGDLDDDIGNYGIYRANLNGSGTPHRLIDVTYNDFTGFSIADSTLSPDGNRLVFANQSRQILVSNVNGASQPPLTAGSTDSQPAWQPLLTDSIKPSVITLTPNPTLITDANSGTATFSITVVFDEPMNTSIKPTLAFPMHPRRSWGCCCAASSSPAPKTTCAFSMAPHSASHALGAPISNRPTNGVAH